MDEKDAKLLKTLVAFGQANPDNKTIGSLILNTFMEKLMPSEESDEEQMTSSLADIELQKYAAGDTKALDRINTLRDGGLSAYKELVGTPQDTTEELMKTMQGQFDEGVSKYMKEATQNRDVSTANKLSGITPDELDVINQRMDEGESGDLSTVQRILGNDNQISRKVKTQLFDQGYRSDDDLKKFLLKKSVEDIYNARQVPQQ